MNRHSILFKINITFALSFTILLLFFILARHIIDRAERFHFLRQVLIIAKTGKILKNESASVTLIKNENELKNILKNGSIILRKKGRRFKRFNIMLLNFDGGMYAYFKSKNGNVIIKRNGGINAQRILLFAWIGLNLILAFLYISIYRSIHPLGRFRKKMEDFKNGDININLEEYIKRKDEIGFIANEFQKAVDNIKKNLNTRVWFIRNIAHELKTPITKGKIALELLEKESNDKKAMLSNIFTRLELLINELLMVEKISITDARLNVSSYRLANIIDKAGSLLFEGNLQIDLQSDADYIIKADFELFAIAVKNLLDNGIKFSDDKRVGVKIEKGVIRFISRGEKPSISADLIFEPFFKDRSIKNKDGFGLGLYITKQILEKHGLNIIYSYESGQNVFCIDLNKLII